MTAANVTPNRYDPRFVKVVFGLFFASLVGVLAILQVAPNLIVR
jgi:hypothetical protein